MDVAAFFTKWAQDLEDGQAGSGAYPPVAPWPNISNLQEDGGPAWADAGIIVPWTMYRCYGDKRILEEHYRSMTRFIDYLVKSSSGYIRCHPDYKGFRGYGDWLSIRAETPKDLVGTAFFAHSTSLMVKIAQVLVSRPVRDRRRFTNVPPKTATYPPLLQSAPGYPSSALAAADGNPRTHRTAMNRGRSGASSPDEMVSTQ